MTTPRISSRYALLDELRGLDLLSMMLYHGLWDVVFLFGVPLAWYTGQPGHWWQQSIAGCLFCCRGSAFRWGVTRTNGGQWSSGPGRWSRR